MLRFLVSWILTCTSLFDGCVVMAVKGPHRQSASSSTTTTTTSTLDFFGQPTTTPITSSDGSGSFLSPVFGVSKRLPNVLSVRGGDVLEPADASDVDSILLRAGSESKLVVIDFSATWCGPCKMIAPLFKELSEQYDDVVFVKVDVDENPETAQKYGVSAMPTFVFIKGGEVIDRLMGANPARLQELIDEHK